MSRSDVGGLDLKYETVIDALYFEAKAVGASGGKKGRGVTFIEDDGEETFVSYDHALSKAYGRAGALQRRGVGEAEPVPVVLPTTRDFLYIFFGLQAIGAIPVPLSPPASFGELAEFGERLSGIARYLCARRIVTTRAMRDFVAGSLEGVDVVLAEDLRAEAEEHGPKFHKVDISGDDVAFIQCTSGSTGVSKGVVLTHENLISNVYQIGWCTDVRPTDATFSWLPLYHDMGLIGCLLFAIYWDLESVFMSPLRFLRNPVTWLQGMAKHRASMTTAPNFAYAFVASRAKDEDLQGLDLSCWRLAGCGAEPIDRRTLERFVQRFAAYGLSPTVCVPCYGLAEATLAVTFHRSGKPLVVDRIDRTALAERGVAHDVAPGTPDAIEVVSCGRPMPETLVRIVDESGKDLPENFVGKVLVHGPTVMKGYYRLPEMTAETIKGGWLDTGDLGYLRRGELRITGREKDLVIIRGKNYLPSDFEWAAEEVAGVRKGNAVAFGRADAESGTEVLHLVCETDLVDPAARAALAEEVAAHVAGKTGIRPAEVTVVPRDTIPKTSSGKLQRRRVKERTLAGTLLR
jgi:acyl-CoA synthetase (AMP-forming)/AMP-acid ligase II